MSRTVVDAGLGGRRLLRAVLTAVLATALAATAGCSSPPANRSATPSPSPRPTVSIPQKAPSGRPNIVFVLTDDLTQDLVRFMPHVLGMQQEGMTFTNYTVTDSQCCPSRSSILTGSYPHNTRVFTNNPPWGGYKVFHRRGEERSTFATALHDRGYRTAFMGKYLNGYQTGSTADPITPRPPGWDEWDGVGYGYGEFDYDIAHNGTTTFYGHRPADYLTTVLQQRATDFISTAATSSQPFLLEVATFTPHTPSIPAPEDAHAFPHLAAPRSPAFNTLPQNPPAWLAGRQALDTAVLRGIDHRYQRRARDVLSIDRLVGAVEQALAESGAARDTIVVFSSDNGYHLGEYRLPAGKMTAFDTDVRVPLVVTGPHVRAGVRNADAVQNIDLAPTFEELAGLEPSPRMDGVSFAGLLHHPMRRWRNAALIEHHGPDTNVSDPDFPGLLDANPPSYEAMRTGRYTYVEYTAGGTELYDRRVDPFELHNIAAQVPRKRLARLHRELVALARCHGAVQCAAARNAR